MTSFMFVVTAAVFAISALATGVLVRAGARRWLLDHPNERSLHERPTPRSGGLAVALAVAIGGTVLAGAADTMHWLSWLAVGSAIIFAVSFRDDISHVHPAIRISVHFLVALLLVYAGLEVDALELPGLRWSFPTWLAVVITCLYTAWIINLYNFMDGMDGFAGGMAVFGFATFAILGALAGVPIFAGVSAVIAAAAAGYLVFNFPPARIFMGDAGSSLLGFLAAGLSLWASVEGIFPLWIAVLVFSPFIADATYTLARRAWNRERVWEAHKSHAYQRLVQLGWGHRKTVLWEYLLMLLCAVSGLIAWGLDATGQWWLLVVWIAIYVILIALVSRLEGRVESRETLESL